MDQHGFTITPGGVTTVAVEAQYVRSVTCFSGRFQLWTHFHVEQRFIRLYITEISLTIYRQPTLFVLSFPFQFNINDKLVPKGSSCYRDANNCGVSARSRK